MIFKSKGDAKKVIMAFVITTGISLVLAVGLLLLTDLYPSRPYTSDSFVVFWFFGFLAIIFGLISGTYQYNKLKKESGVVTEKLSDEEELEIQVENYNNLGITKSNKGQATLFLGVVIVLSIALGIFDVTPMSDVLYSLIIYIPLMFFIYKGHRWAMYLGIVLWTLEKGYQLFYSSNVKMSGIIVIFSFWLWLVTILYSAIQVENERKKRAGIKKQSENTQSYHSERNILEGKYFCSGCGKEINYKGSFCKFCGKKIE